MRLFLRIGVSVACFAAICGAAITRHIYKRHQQAAEAKKTLLSAKQGDVKAELRLADMYHDGRGVTLDYAEALRWYRKVADRDAKAQYAIGYMYDVGQGLPQDYAQAALWYRRAADLGYSRAQCALGSMYYDGRGLRQDYPESAYWYRKAADQGFARARYDLGYMYENGEGVPRAPAEAKRLYRIAAAQGDELALRAVGGKLSILGALLLVAQFLGGIWLSLHYVVSHPSAPSNIAGGPRRVLIIGTGLLGALSAAFNWLGFANHRIRSLSYGLDLFNSVRWLSYSILIALLIYIVLSGKHSGKAGSIKGDVK
jgi:Sel1 repeat